MEYTAEMPCVSDFTVLVRHFNLKNELMKKSLLLPIVTPVVLVLNGAIIAPLERLFFLTIHTTTPAIMATHIIAPTTAPAIVPPLLKRRNKNS